MTSPKTPKTPMTPKKTRLPSATSRTQESYFGMANLYSPKLRGVQSILKDESISEARETSRAAKRDFSNISDASSNAIEIAKQTTCHGAKGSDEYIAFIREEAQKKFSAWISVMEAEVNYRDKSMKKINDSWHAGDLTLAKAQLEEEITNLEKGIGELSARILVARSSQNQILGAMADLELWHKKRDIGDWAYLDLLINRQRPPVGATVSHFRSRDNEEQECFRRAVIKSYGAKKTSHPNSAIWCVVAGRYMTKASVRAAHIVRYNVGEGQAEYLFGSSNHRNGHLMSPSNGLPMCEMYEELFDNGRIVFTPDVASKDSIVIQVLDKELLDEDGSDIGMEPWGKDLDGRKLTFPEGCNFRPQWRYMYCAYSMTLIRRQRYECPGWHKEQLKNRGQRMWASPGDYLRNSALTMLANRVGHMSLDDATKFGKVFEDFPHSENSNVDRRDQMLVDATLSVRTKE
ncbi:hypothetical protein GGR57DRAFT_511735 [Xylariaceae sp. FL1272]|nr:hypothetical protein GGR57DRAFT_511735 [Xylariaceae sp. FL1272]